MQPTRDGRERLKALWKNEQGTRHSSQTFLLQRARGMSCFRQHFRSSFRWRSWEESFTSAVSDSTYRRGVLPELDVTAIQLCGVGIPVRLSVSPAVLAPGWRCGPTQAGKCCRHLSSKHVRGLAHPSGGAARNRVMVALRLAVAASFATAALTFPAFSGLWLFPTPSYKWAAFQGLLVTLIGMLLAERAHHRRSTIGWELDWSRGWLTFMGKPTSAASPCGAGRSLSGAFRKTELAPDSHLIATCGWFASCHCLRHRRRRGRPSLTVMSLALKLAILSRVIYQIYYGLSLLFYLKLHCLVQVICSL